MSDVIINCQSLSKTYHDGSMYVAVLKDINFSINQGATVAIVGPSGSGKSTLLHLLGGLDKPSQGHVFVRGTDWQVLTEKERCRLRNQTLGFIYQFHHLLPEFTALENVAMPILIAGNSIARARMLAEEILDTVGLSQRLSHKPAQLSGGERQRVAIARALVHQPGCVLADEPTGNLDHATAVRIFDLMLKLNSERNTALVIVTHDIALAKQMDIVFDMQQLNAI